VAHSIASEQVSWQGMGARVPKGTIHAVIEGLKTTACGRSLDRLHKFPDVDFDPLSMIDGACCTDCLKWTSGTVR
jgi:hypothetical protein